MTQFDHPLADGAYRIAALTAPQEVGGAGPFMEQLYAAIAGTSKNQSFSLKEWASDNGVTPVNAYRRGRSDGFSRSSLRFVAESAIVIPEWLSHRHVPAFGSAVARAVRILSRCAGRTPFQSRAPGDAEASGDQSCHQRRT